LVGLIQPFRDCRWKPCTIARSGSIGASRNYPVGGAAWWQGVTPLERQIEGWSDSNRSGPQLGKQQLDHPLTFEGANPESTEFTQTKASLATAPAAPGRAVVQVRRKLDDLA